MKFRLARFVLIIAIALFCAALLQPSPASAQSDATGGDPPSLGDLARNLRKSKALQPAPAHAAPTVIDNENLNQVMDDAKNARPVKDNKTVFSIDPASETIQVSSPDVTCSLAFNARSATLLSRPTIGEDLPLTELVKIDGPGAIQDGNLQLALFNGTTWNLNEITVGLTLERNPGANAALAQQPRLIPASQSSAANTSSANPSTNERRSDVTLLYHLKADAKPFTTAAFRHNIGITPRPDEDWRWSIVEAKGVRPTQPPPANDQRAPMFATPPQSQAQTKK